MVGRIEICGGIASGKTTFASFLAKTGINPIYESFHSNPFWEAFYSDPKKYTFETEISFMLQHYHQINKQCADNKIMVCDYSFLLDMAYAEMGLQGSRLAAFKVVYEEIKKELPPPALIIHLQCDPETELTRISNRGRVVEKSITTDFLRLLNDSIEAQIDKARSHSKIISVDSSKMNFVDDESVKAELVQLVAQALKIPSL
ncbi:MAG: deoxynucleoside kinase [Desulfuromonadaceae bacterium]|nr:deoxynucleoside kinase [Desulfuromonadaceae bacterium]MDD5106677.1 deoxynucleoside kinase [Desulfuromonadaceae bacterium]